MEEDPAGAPPDARPDAPADMPPDAAPDAPAAPRPLRLTSRTRQADWRRANPARYAAHLAVRRALVAGSLEKQGCEVCGSPAVDAHHACYAAPLDVRWLCRCHHVRLHRGGEDLFATGSKRADAEGKGAGHAGANDKPDEGNWRSEVP